MVDESLDGENNLKKRGRKANRPKNETQHSVYIEDDLWDEAGALPISRPDIVRQAFINAISYYKSDLPKLRWQLEDIRSQISALQSKEALILTRIHEMEEEEDQEVIFKQRSVKSKEDAVNEMMRLCSVFRKKMNHEHYVMISKLSGIEPAQIAVFLEDRRWRPTLEDAKAFMMG